MKRCAKCKIEKALEEFGKNARSGDGLSSYCILCYREMHRIYREARAAREGRVLARTPKAPGQKWCPDCQGLRQVTEFGRNRSMRDGLAGYCRPCQNARVRESIERLHGGARHYHLVRRYGISAADADALLEAQGGLCAICERDLGEKPHIDHDHATGKVRGLLCFNCNGGLGQFGDDELRLRAAVEYLRTARGESDGHLALVYGLPERVDHDPPEAEDDAAPRAG